MRRKTGYKILLAAMMALAIANVYVGKALDVHANDPLSRAECAASGSDATVEEYCLICHFHLAGGEQMGVAVGDVDTLMPHPVSDRQGRKPHVD